jgi:type I restriction enzyme M protein
MFYNTGISTYVWILSNDKSDNDRVKLIDGRHLGTKMPKSLGDKRKELTPDAIAQIAQLYGGALGEFANDQRVRVLPREAFGFQRITVERPLVADNGVPALKKGKPQPAPNLREQENVPLPDGWFDLGLDERTKALRETAEQHLIGEIHPYVPDAWIDHTRTKIGVEIPFTRQFYVSAAPRPIEEIAAEIKELRARYRIG